MVNFLSKRRHQSKTDPDSRLYKKAKGKQVKHCYLGQAMMENRNGLVADAMVDTACSTAKRQAAMMIDQVAGKQRITVGAESGYEI